MPALFWVGRLMLAAILYVVVCLWLFNSWRKE